MSSKIPVKRCVRCRDARGEARTLLREKRLSSPQRLALDREIGRVEAVLDGIDARPGR